MGEDGPPGERQEELDADLFDVRDLRFVLPPLERPPFAEQGGEGDAPILHVIRQAVSGPPGRATRPADRRRAKAA